MRAFFPTIKPLSLPPDRDVLPPCFRGRYRPGPDRARRDSGVRGLAGSVCLLKRCPFCRGKSCRACALGSGTGDIALKAGDKLETAGHARAAEYAEKQARGMFPGIVRRHRRKHDARGKTASLRILSSQREFASSARTQTGSARPCSRPIPRSRARSTTRHDRCWPSSNRRVAPRCSMVWHSAVFGTGSLLGVVRRRSNAREMVTLTAPVAGSLVDAAHIGPTPGSSEQMVNGKARNAAPARQALREQHQVDVAGTGLKNLLLLARMVGTNHTSQNGKPLSLNLRDHARRRPVPADGEVTNDFLNPRPRKTILGCVGNR